MNQGPPDPHAPESQPTRQGRRLIRMLFRTGTETTNEETNDQDSRAEDAGTCKEPTDHQVNNDKHAPVPTTSSKFATLKRKLFPSQNRRHPRHVPPLISPISALVKSKLPPIGDNVKSLSFNSTSREDDNSNEQNQINSEVRNREDVLLKFPEFDSQEDTPESNFSAEGDNNLRTTGRRMLMDDDDDRDLESAVEALDLESSIADKTLEEMSKAIDDLRVWKEAQFQATQAALIKLQSQQEPQPLAVDSPHNLTTNEDPLEAQLEFKLQQQQRDREAQALELRKEAEAYQLECSTFKTKLDDSEATRVEEALQNSTDSEGLALSRLRNELFQLDVKQRQEALMQELQGADSELDMNIVDVQVFTGELDAILAQFDSLSADKTDSECLSGRS